jgi:hypothetical protein
MRALRSPSSSHGTELRIMVAGARFRAINRRLLLQRQRLRRDRGSECTWNTQGLWQRRPSRDGESAYGSPRGLAGGAAGVWLRAEVVPQCDISRGGGG